jgi:hypothetical protein
MLNTKTCSKRQKRTNEVNREQISRKKKFNLRITKIILMINNKLKS